MLNAVQAAAFYVFLYMLAAFVFALIIKRNDVADAAWGGGFILAALAGLFSAASVTPRALLVTALVAVWGLRLALHIGLRNFSKGEDHRYRKWRQDWGRYFLLRTFLQIFMLQGLLLVLVSVPVIYINAAPPAPISWLDIIGAARAVQICDELTKAHGPCFAAPALLRDMAASGALFYPVAKAQAA